ARPMTVRGSIKTSLYQDAQTLGAAAQQVVDVAPVFAYDLDFQREVHPGDKFELVFDVMTDERGKVIRRGDVIYAALNGKAVDKAFYRYTTPDEDVTDYFQANGESSTKFLMKTPINGARLSSRFGKRRHPISGYTRLHKGTDFAAPTGTPIYAAGNGVVERASRYGGYGHYIRIRHAKGYKTAYAHLSRYARGVKSGRRVKQGQIIGYVGSTGASTGPHLHYEVYKNGKAVDVMRLKLPTGRKLAMDPDVFEAFAVERDRIDAIRGDERILPEFVVATVGAPPAP
ncbi:MAG: M23 family metallopeptidase, partial [Pseudomonadota bacterium]